MFTYPVLGTTEVSSPSFRPLASYTETRQNSALFNRLNALCITLGLASWTHLIFQSHFSGQNIICVPLLVQSQAQILHFVLGLQVSSCFSGVCVTGSAGGEILRNERETVKGCREREEEQQRERKRTVSQINRK